MKQIKIFKQTNTMVLEKQINHFLQYLTDVEKIDEDDIIVNKLHGGIPDLYVIIEFVIDEYKEIYSETLDFKKYKDKI